MGTTPGEGIGRVMSLSPPPLNLDFPDFLPFAESTLVPPARLCTNSAVCAFSFSLCVGLRQQDVIVITGDHMEVLDRIGKYELDMRNKRLKRAAVRLSLCIPGDRAAAFPRALRGAVTGSGGRQSFFRSCAQPRLSASVGSWCFPGSVP